MPVAIIDLGTNTFHLLLAEPQPDGTFRPLHAEKRAARLGQGGISQGVISPEAWERALACLQDFRRTIDEARIPAGNVYATATSAVRNAANGPEFVAAVAAQTGIRVRVLSGEEEAQYIYQGVRQALDLSQVTNLIIDIGGGSVEFILANGERIFWKRSFEIGGQRLMDQFMTTDPLPPAAVGHLHSYLDEQLLPLTNAVHQYRPVALVGSSGTFDTLTEMHYRRTDPLFSLAGSTAWELPVAGFRQTYAELLGKNRQERLQMPGMIELRVDMIVVAGVLVDWVLQKYGLERIRVSAYALKEGLLGEISSS